MYKQAYLIIAHRYDETFKTLLRMLDSEENDIFIHMDIKNKQFRQEECKELIQHGKIFFTERTNVSWGGYSQINSELLLLEAAVMQNHYNYYHLLSGQDLPIKSAEYIKKFFIKNQGKEFVCFDKEIFECYDRVQYCYPFQEMIGRDRKCFWGRLAAVLTIFQKIFRIRRNQSIVFQKGANWFSITDDLARYVIQQKKWIEAVFSNTICCDEVFLQTIIINSRFKEKIYQFAEKNNNTEEASMRMVDWKRGGPYVFQRGDYQELTQSQMLFARKFDYNQDAEIINMLLKVNCKER